MNETIIAVGNGGINLAIDLIAAGLFPDSQLVVCDTNEKDLEKHSANETETFLLEKLRSKVKSDDTPIVEDIVAKASDSIIICATLGGMTGSKYAPLIALEAILRGKFVWPLFSMPYEFEGEQKTKRAMNARMQLIASSNLAVHQNNDRLKEVESLGLNDIDKPLVETIKSAMKDRFAAIYLRLMKYAMFMGILGGIASFIGPPHHGLIKAGIGIVVGAMLLGNKLPLALKDFATLLMKYQTKYSPNSCIELIVNGN